jgi:hypothetical protein
VGTMLLDKEDLNGLEAGAWLHGLDLDGSIVFHDECGYFTLR